MNGNGLSDKLNKEFPKLVPVIRPARQEGRSLGSATTVEIYNPSWLSGFIDAEGGVFLCAYHKIFKTGYQVSLVFQITQDIQDKELL